MKAILAKSLNQGIGINNEMPWTLKKEMYHFRNTTLGGTVIMGYNTFKSMGFKELPDRKNIIIDRNSDLEKIAKENPDAFVIGGNKTFELLNEYIDEYIITEVKDYFIADTFFNMNLLKDFKLKDKGALTYDIDLLTGNDVLYQINKYIRC